MKPQLDMEASQALARLAPLTTSSSSSTSAAGVGGGGGGGGGIVSSSHSHSHHHSHQQQRDKRSTRQQRAAWVRQHLAGLRTSLRQQLVLSELLVLSEGATVVQDSHVILMKGSIQVRACQGVF